MMAEKKGFPDLSNKDKECPVQFEFHPPGLAAREPGALDASCDFSRSRVPIPEMEDVGLVDDMTINRHGVCGALLHARHPHGAVQVS